MCCCSGKMPVACAKTLWFHAHFALREQNSVPHLTALLLLALAPWESSSVGSAPANRSCCPQALVQSPRANEFPNPPSASIHTSEPHAPVPAKNILWLLLIGSARCVLGLPALPPTAAICMTHLQGEVIKQLPIPFTECERL